MHSCFADAEDSLHHLSSKDIDIVLMDIGLPGMDGIECMTILKPGMPKILFMMYTVCDDDDHIFNALQSGASAYILKRTYSSQVLEAIGELQEGGSHMSREIARLVIY